MQGGAAPLARIVPSSSFVCDGLLRARRPALTGPSGGGLGIASVRSLYGQPAAGYLRFAPVARPTRDAHLLHGLPTPGLRWLGGAWSWGQVTPGYSRRTTLWFEGGRCDRPQGSHKNDTSGVEPVERPSHEPPRGTRGDRWGGHHHPQGWSIGASRVVSRTLKHPRRSRKPPLRSPRLRTTTPKIPRRSPELLSTTPEHRRTSPKLRHRTLKHRHTCP